MKSIKRKDQTTKDISGHRLRTKNKSSSSRANANYPTPTPYAGRKRVKSDRASKASPSFVSRPSERQRPWSGDISGKPLRIVARNKKLERGTLYPPKVYKGAALGSVPVRKKPQEKQRAWKGGIDHRPVKNQSATGQIKNVYPKSGRYVSYLKKQTKTTRRSGSNSAVIGLASRQSPGTPRKNGITPRSASGLFVRQGTKPQSASGNFIKRGKKNVYWGKFSKGEKAVTTDLTGRPVRARNFHSAPAGAVDYDSLSRLSTRRAGGDRAYRGLFGGFSSVSKRGQRAWNGDISGQNLRTSNPKKSTEKAGEFVFPRKLSISGSGESAGSQLAGGGYSSRSRQRVGNQPLPPKAPGIGAVGIDGKGNKGFGKSFNTQGAGYNGATKTKRQPKGGGSISGKLWNNRQAPVGVRPPGQGYIRGGSFQGNIPRGARSYRDQGENFTGFTKARPRNYRDQGENFTGFTKARIPNYGDQGENFTGYTKARRQTKGGGSISGKLWNNGQAPVGVRTPGQGSVNAGSFQGNTPRSTRTYRDQGENFTGFIKARTPNYGDQGENFTGYTKARKQIKGGGSISGKLWNNGQAPVGVRTPGQGSVNAGSFQGNIPRRPDNYRDQGENFSGFIRASPRNYRDQGEDFTGYTKARKPIKGGGSVSGKLWNNGQTPVGVRTPGQGSVNAGSFQGNIPRRPNNYRDQGENFTGFIKASPRNYPDQGEDFTGYTKARRPVKGGGSISGKLWNNGQSPIGVRTPGQGSVRAGGFQGNIPKESVNILNDQGEGFAGYIKSKRPVKGGGSITTHWNNNEQPIGVRTPGKGAIDADYSGKIKSSGYTQNPNASKESTLKQRPDKTTYQVAGLQIKVKEGNYKEKPNAIKSSLPGVAPARSSVKASEYVGTLKLYWSYKHNPSSADDAQKAIYFGKAYAHIGDYQGNIKMHKYNDNRLHPDSQFAHNFQDNVKGEKSVMTDIKLLWSKVFGKNDTQPQNLKEKSERPRYEKSEKGLWIDDPDYQKKKLPER